MQTFLTYIAGVVFGVGISMSGMGNPAKVLNFFDFAGTWDASLIFVMGGAFVVTAIGYFFVLRRPKPIFEPKFSVPTSRVIDAKLVGGSAVFGVGWGISGFCPGASLPVISTLNPGVLMFTASLLVGVFTARAMMRFTATRKAAVPAQ